ncbi:hypothetical protein [Sinisalibacter aestuarii]|uniref:Uncharacterized protein n=1 Tax=Sinisalibacter aestuarii TaxID=2949426 RepID=A0ABQ5LTH3_9RHOB|nr:hypothetical protein [Sinisalibacter aestuarii]GKY88289.1 hypothetical protein STA1M1_21580 [Sinisalibacter aestuarii]
MTQAETQQVARSGTLVWIFRILVIAAGAYMAYSWFQPWWIADMAVIKGDNDIVLHPWGVEVVRQVRVQADPALYEMPGFFAPFTWVYFSLAMLALVVSLFWKKTISLGRFKVSYATIMILLVGLSYLITVGLAYGIGNIRAEATGINFIGKSEYTDPMSHRKMKLVADLQIGYWHAVYAAAALFVLGLLRGLFNRTQKA